MSINISVQSSKNSTPPRIVLHGGEKVGKSTFASMAPRPWFLPTEQGLSGLDAQMIVGEGESRLKTLQELYDALDYCADNLDKFDTLVVDSADWTEALIHKDIVDRDDKATNMGEACGGYSKAYIEGENIWRELVDRLDWFNQQEKMIILICHSKAVTFDDPLSESYDIWQLKLHSTKNGTGALTVTKEWADIIAFAEIDTLTRKASKGSEKNLTMSSGKRTLHLEATAAFIAGCRYPWMPKKMDLDMDAFMKAFYESK